MKTIILLATAMIGSAAIANEYPTKNSKQVTINYEQTKSSRYKNLAKNVVVSLYQRKGDTVSVTEITSKEKNVLYFDVSLTNASKSDSAVYSVRIEGRAEKGDDVNISISLVPAGE